MEPITLPGNLDSLDAIADYVIQAAAEAGLNKKASYKLRLAVDEIATNIITHGYDESGLQGDLFLSVNIDQSTLKLTIEDSGISFDPYSRKLPSEEDLKRELSDRAIGGLGLFLAIKEVDKFLYERVNDRNRNIFIMNITTS